MFFRCYFLTSRKIHSQNHVTNSVGKTWTFVDLTWCGDLTRTQNAQVKFTVLLYFSVQVRSTYTVLHTVTSVHSMTQLWSTELINVFFVPVLQESQTIMLLWYVWIQLLQQTLKTILFLEMYKTESQIYSYHT